MSDDDSTGFTSRIRDQLGTRAIEPLVRAVRAEIHAARDEVAERARGARSGAVLLAVGALPAVVTLALAAAVVVVALFALTLPWWAAALVTFALFAVTSAVTVAVGLKGVRRGLPPLPADTVHDLSTRD